MIDESLRFALPGTALIGAVAGLVGSFAVIRRQSLQGDAISHAALPGVGLAFLLGTRSGEGIALGAAVIGWLAMLAVRGLVCTTRLSFDVILGGTLAVFFAFGIAMLDRIRRQHGGAGNSLDHYLFGQAALMNAQDVGLIAVVGLVSLIVLLLFWKQFKLIAFDPDYAVTLGVPLLLMDAVYTFLLVAAVVVGLQAVGVVLMSALIVAPAVAARQWTHRLGPMVALAMLFGSVSGIIGTISAHGLSDHFIIPTGPAIVLTVSGVVLLSLMRGVRR